MDDPREPADTVMRFGTDTITLRVGPEKVEMLLHRSHAQTSKFLTAASKKEWNGEGKELLLPDNKLETVRRYLHYLYTGKIATRVDSLWAEADDEEYANLAELYVLGEKYQDDSLRNAIIAAIGCKCNDTEIFPCGLAVDIIYRGTCAGSPLRKLMVDMHVHSGSQVWVNGCALEELNKEFLMELSARSLEELRENRMRGDRDSIDWSKHVMDCEYHVHGEKGECPMDEDRVARTML